MEPWDMMYQGIANVMGGEITHSKDSCAFIGDKYFRPFLGFHIAIKPYLVGLRHSAILETDSALFKIKGNLYFLVRSTQEHDSLYMLDMEGKSVDAVKDLWRAFTTDHAFLHKVADRVRAIHVNNAGVWSVKDVKAWRRKHASAMDKGK